MDYTTLYHWFFTFWAFIYGLMIGSFLNVCIYRMPPRIYFFDDITQKTVSDFEYYFHRLLVLLRIRKEDSKPVVEPSLYAEGLMFLTIAPETVTHASIAHNFNLFRLFYPDPVTIVKPRSFCPFCKNMIRWWMNIPILSYLILGGKCYYCKARISPRYLVIELLTGVIWGALFYIYGLANIHIFLYYATLASLCIIVFFIDLDHWIIMDEITLPFTVVGILGALFMPYRLFVPYPDLISFLQWNQIIPSWLYNWYVQLVHSSPPWLHLDSFLQSVAGAIIGFAGLWSIGVIGTILLKREAMGGGDVKLVMLMGAYLGVLKMGMAFFVAVLVGTVLLLPLLLIKKKTGKDQVPFGCFLSLATVITIFWGDAIIWFFFSWPEILLPK